MNKHKIQKLIKYLTDMHNRGATTNYPILSLEELDLIIDLLGQESLKYDELILKIRESNILEE